MKTTTTYTVSAPKVAGHDAAVIGTAAKLSDARRIADEHAELCGRWLKRQDVRIERDGELVEYAGPAR